MKRKPEKVLILTSGGLDSVCLISKAILKKREPVLIFFNYGQKNFKKELEALKKFIKENKKKSKDIRITLINRKINLGFTNSFMQGKSKNKKKEWVPLRNLLFLSLASSFGVNYKISEVWLGSTKEDSFPDNNFKFGNLFNKVLKYSSYDKIKLKQPFVNKNKYQMIKINSEFPLYHSWSCYKNFKKQCGKCRSCKERKAAFKKAGKIDRTEYLN